MRPSAAQTCQTPRMRPLQALAGFLIWRVALARTGLRLRLHGMVAILVTFGGIGAAIGYAIVGRFLAGSGAEDEAEIRPDAE